LISAIIGLIGNEKRSAIFLKIKYFLLFLDILGALWVITSIFLAKANSYLYLSNEWDYMPSDIKLRVQTSGSCCGFGSIHDRLQQPCSYNVTKGENGVSYIDTFGCFNSLNSQFLQFALYSQICLYILIAVLLGAMHFTFRALRQIIEEEEIIVINPDDGLHYRL
jgi:hypothetical protein